MKDNAKGLVADPKRLEQLTRVYRLYDEVIQEFALACRQGCATCCTCNVTATSLEVAYFFSGLDAQGVANVRARLADGVPDLRYQPVLTLNRFAAHCLANESLPEEENDPLWGNCPLLADGQCTVYPVRPFGCRSMMSETDCADAGFARVPPLALTIANIFGQYIEHLDKKGVSGNLSDVLALYLDPAGPAAPGAVNSGKENSLENMADSGKKRGIIQNARIPAFMVPPEHRSAAAPILEKLIAPEF